MKRLGGALAFVVVSGSAGAQAACADSIAGPGSPFVASDPYSAGLFFGSGVLVLVVVVVAAFALRRLAHKRRAEEASSRESHAESK